MSTALLRDLSVSELAIVKAAGASGDTGITLEEAEAITAPAPAMHTLSWLYCAGILQAAENDAGTPRPRHMKLTEPAGLRLLARYESGQKKAKPDPVQHEEIPAAELKASGMTVVEPEKPASKHKKTTGKAKRKATANA